MKRIRKNTIITTSAMLSLAVALSGCDQNDPAQPQETANASASSASSSSAPALMEMKEGDVALAEALKGVNEATFLTIETKDSADSNSGVIVERDGKNKTLHMSVKDESGKIVDEFIQTPDRSYTVITEAYADQYPDVEVGSWVYTEERGEELFFNSLFSPQQSDLDNFEGIEGEQVDLNGRAAYKYYNVDQKVSFWIDAQNGQLLMIADDEGMQVTFSDFNADKSVEVPSSAKPLEEVLQPAASDSSSSSASAEVEPSSDSSSEPNENTDSETSVKPSQSASPSSED